MGFEKPPRRLSFKVKLSVGENNGFTGSLQGIMMRCSTKEPKETKQTHASEQKGVREALRSYLHKVGIHTRWALALLGPNDLRFAPRYHCTTMPVST